jgi:DNA polymerase-1
MAARDMLFGWSSTGSISASELFRSSWIAEEGCVLIDFDYSAIEPRITAQRTKDKTLISIFCEGKDMHMMTGMAALNLTEVPEKGTEEFEYVRNIVGKIVNLGLGYGMGARGLAEFLYDKTNGLIDYRADISKAQVIIDRYFELYEGVLRKIEWAEDKATKKLKEAGTLAAFRNRRPFGVVHSIEGRPRRFCIMKEHEDSSIFSLEELREDYNPTEKRHYYNEFRRRVNKVRLAAYNSLIQSSAADMLKRAELSVWRKLRKMYASGEFDPRFEHVKLVLHDEILVQARKENAAKMARLVYDSMMEEGQKILKVVPTVVDGGMGYSWHSAKKSKLDFTSSATLLACVQESLSMLDEQREYNKRRTAA